jgi:hypothetical protein
MSKNRKSDNARDTFAKVGDDEAEVVNTSGAHWPGAQVQARPRTITRPPPGRSLRPRTPVEIDAESGRALDENMQKATMAAVRRASIKAAVDRAAPGERKHLAFLFGLDRDREV